jgi:hypothetical protein
MCYEFLPFFSFFSYKRGPLPWSADGHIKLKLVSKILQPFGSTFNSFGVLGLHLHLGFFEVRYIYGCNYFDVLGSSTTLDCPEVTYHYLMYSSAVAGAKFDTSLSVTARSEGNAAYISLFAPLNNLSMQQVNSPILQARSACL